MNDKFLNFIKENGKPVSEVDPGSDEFALTSDDALHAIELLKEGAAPIIGGEAFVQGPEKIEHAYKVLGDQYHTLDWSSDPKEDSETDEGYANRTYEVAKGAIAIAIQAGKNYNQEMLIGLIV